MTAMSVQVEARPCALELDPRETAVIVVDMQQGFFGTGGAWNRAGVDVANTQAIVAPIARVLTGAREVGMPVIYATMDLDAPAPAGAAPGYWTEERSSRWVAAGEPREAMDLKAIQLAPGVAESDILPELAPRPGETIIVKPRFSAFYDTSLHLILKELGVSTLIFTGGTTSICVESTLRDAFFRDHRCLLLADCTAEPIGNRSRAPIERRPFCSSNWCTDGSPNRLPSCERSPSGPPRCMRLKLSDPV
jgi:ureidoacrylate peracid hydrolase